MTSAEKDAAGASLISAWTTPVRISGEKGEKGDKGTDGSDGRSPALVFRGDYSSSATYYGNQYRLDAVKYSGTYYIARLDAGTFSGVTPTTTSKWNTFGATLESIATGLLLAENANIAGWIFRNGRMESQNGGTYLDGRQHGSLVVGKADGTADGGLNGGTLDDSAVRFWVSGSDPANAPFRVERGGDMFSNRIYAGYNRNNSSFLSASVLYVGALNAVPTITRTIIVYGNSTYPPEFRLYTGENSSIPFFNVIGKKYSSEWFNRTVIRCAWMPTKAMIQGWYGTVDERSLKYDINSGCLYFA
jgi:hypothetical protein